MPRSDRWPPPAAPDPEACTEVLRSTLHGLAALTGSSRLRPGAHRARLDLLVGLLTAGT
ncbi:hypothetical protein [Streptomyces sp. NRRL B-24484]|uniref:hypothetical protein n=1 Tax=Streptomyces sp. NRRL B-24484 TaxID=1463833 RepID=UPI000ACD59BC|nr:hypothetical protein [Streptomyces sp. NRRL B-24484]